MTTDNPVLDAIAGRRSVRGFLDRPVPRSTVELIIAAAARAPSGTNTQPWRVHVLTGAARGRLIDAIMAERGGGAPEPAPEYPYYPDQWPEPYLARRRAIGWQLYAALGIARGDRGGSRAWHDQNFRFFGAPVGLVFTLDRRLAQGSMIDIGLFMGGIMTAARGLGLETCPQAAFASYHATIRRLLALPPEDMVVCGMALGHPDRAAPANQVHAERAPLSDYAAFHND